MWKTDWLVMYIVFGNMTDDMLSLKVYDSICFSLRRYKEWHKKKKIWILIQIQIGTQVSRHNRIENITILSPPCLCNAHTSAHEIFNSQRAFMINAAVNIASHCLTFLSLLSPSGLHGGERVWGPKPRDNNIPLQIHHWCLSKELWLQRCSARQPARRGHPVRSQEGQRVWEEHSQPASLQVCIHVFCSCCTSILPQWQPKQGFGVLTFLFL